MWLLQTLDAFTITKEASSGGGRKTDDEGSRAPPHNNELLVAVDPDPAAAAAPQLPALSRSDVMLWFYVGKGQAGLDMTMEAAANISRSKWGTASNKGQAGAPSISFSPFQIA